MHWFLLLWLGAAFFLAPRFTMALIVFGPILFLIWYANSDHRPDPAPVAKCYVAPPDPRDDSVTAFFKANPAC
jgi:hypothetical protein